MKINSIIDLVKDLDTSRQTKNLNKLLIRILLHLQVEFSLHNIEELGNTGSVSSALVYAQNDHSFKKGDLVAITVFGGGYSTGACLIKC